MFGIADSLPRNKDSGCEAEGEALLSKGINRLKWRLLPTWPSTHSLQVANPRVHCCIQTMAAKPRSFISLQPFGNPPFKHQNRRVTGSTGATSTIGDKSVRIELADARPGASLSFVPSPASLGRGKINLSNSKPVRKPIHPCHPHVVSTYTHE